MFEKIKCPNGSPSQHLVLVSMYWMTHCIEWSLKMKIKNEIFKVEKLKSENQKQDRMAKWGSERYKIVFRDYVSDLIEWSLKKIENEICKVEKLKSENQKNYKSKNVRKIISIPTDHRTSI